MSRRHGPRSPGWQAFLRNHTAHIAGVDLFVVPTIGFKLLYGLVILGLERRRLVWTNVTANPTAEWIAQQISEAFPWDEAPRYLIRDRDTSYGSAVTRRLHAMGIRDRPITPRTSSSRPMGQTSPPRRSSKASFSPRRSVRRLPP